MKFYEFEEIEECPKCTTSTTYVHVKYKEPGFFEEHLLVTCSHCGFSWEEYCANHKSKGDREDR